MNKKNVEKILNILIIILIILLSYMFIYNRNDSQVKEDDSKIYDLIKQKTIVDLRNILNKKEMEKIGFKYVSIGKI